MRASAHRVAACLAAGALAATVTAVTACGGGERPLRIGVVVDCVGINRSLQGAELAGAELPLLQRGARLRGHGPLEGIAGAHIAGRPVELVNGCTEVLEFSTLTAEARRLIEHEHVDAIVAGGSGPDEVALRDVARRYPRVVFLPVVHGPREVTARDHAPNVYRVAGDHGQGVAGLATYAYRTLGWRRAAVAYGDWDVGWGARDAFVAEFCALGGRVVSQFGSAAFDPRGRDAARVPRAVDGVAVFTPSLFGPAGFLARLAERMRPAARRIVVGPAVVDDPELLRATGHALDGVVASSALPTVERSPQLRGYLRQMAATFPAVSASTARSELVLGYRDAVEFLARAIDRAGGAPARVPAALAGLRTALAAGPVRLDRNGQGVVTTSIVRIGRGARAGDDPRLSPLGEVRGVDQSIGGLLAPALSPSDAHAACRRAPPPPWSG